LDTPSDFFLTGQSIAPGHLSNSFFVGGPI
jgi:hypothetical protein